MSELSLKPQQIKAHGQNAKWWYYEYPGGIDLVIDRAWVMEHSDRGGIIRIPRRLLSDSIGRMNKVASKRWRSR